jgi:MFS family permease
VFHVLLNRHNTSRPEAWTRAEKLLLLVLSGVIFLDGLDISLVQVALPSIGSELHLPDSQLQWVISAFVLGYGGFLLLGGRSADVLGRRRVLVWGLGALVIASALGAFAVDGTLLIAARFVKGVSAAFTAPASLSILSTSFREGHRRNRALGLYAAAAASGFTFGLVVGGLLTQMSWRYTFAVVVPVGLVLLFAALRVIRPDLTNIGGRGRLDLAGAFTITGAVLVFVWAVVEAPAAGWTSGQTLGALAASAALLGLFVAVERTIERPLVRLGILRSATLVRANAGAMLLFGSSTALNFITTLYLQNELGWSPLKTALIFMISGLTTFFVGPRAGSLATRIGSAPILVGGAVAIAASGIVFLDLGVTSNYTVIVSSRLLAGLGFALAYPTLNIQALRGVSDEEQGLASGLVGSSFQIGGALVLALTTAALLAHTPAHATVAQAVRGLTVGVYLIVATAGLFVLLSLASLVAERRGSIVVSTAETGEAEPLKRAA